MKRSTKRASRSVISRRDASAIRYSSDSTLVVLRNQRRTFVSLASIGQMAGRTGYNLGAFAQPSAHREIVVAELCNQFATKHPDIGIVYETVNVSVMTTLH